jgi:hypothetical protein
MAAAARALLGDLIRWHLHAHRNDRIIGRHLIAAGRGARGRRTVALRLAPQEAVGKFQDFYGIKASGEIDNQMLYAPGETQLAGRPDSRMTFLRIVILLYRFV